MIIAKNVIIFNSNSTTTGTSLRRVGFPIIFQQLGGNSFPFDSNLKMNGGSTLSAACLPRSKRDASSHSSHFQTQPNPSPGGGWADAREKTFLCPAFRPNRGSQRIGGRADGATRQIPQARRTVRNQQSVSVEKRAQARWPRRNLWETPCNFAGETPGVYFGS